MRFPSLHPARRRRQSLQTKSGLGLVLLLAAAGCGVFRGPGFDKKDSVPDDDRLVVWMLADIQPVDVAGRKDFERAVEDVRTHVPGVDLAVVAGDLLQARSTADDFDWFLRTRDRAAIPRWFEVAGNHDVRNRALFRRYFPGRDHYAIDVGNVRILCLADVTSASTTEISDEAIAWWQRQVRDHADRILLTVTHAPLRHSGLFTAGVASRRIRQSQPFEDVLPHAKVVLWASGHSHLPQGFHRAAYVNPRLGGTCFLNVSAIRSARFKDSQSRFLIFTEGSRTLWVRSRNHAAGRFNSRLDIALTLDRPFQGAKDQPRLADD